MKNIYYLLLSLAIFSTLGFSPVTTTPVATGKITVKIDGFRNNKGLAGISIYNSAEGFPGDHTKMLKTEFVPIKDNKAEFTFVDLPAGYYAISTFHDENNNGRLENTWYGAPKEGVGVSNNIKGGMGAPKFDEAKFLLDKPEKTVGISIYYL